MNILLDSVFFEVSNTGIARVWHSILNEWHKANITAAHSLYILTRSRAVPLFDGFHYIPFSRSQGFAFSGADSLALQSICDDLSIDVFISSYYTFPIGTKSVMMVYDMIPELFDFPMDSPGWMEKVAAIKHATSYISISESTANDLRLFHPEIPKSSVRVSHCGVDKDVFCIRSDTQVNSFLSAHGIDYPYWIVVGSRDQYNSYKNTRLLFDAIAECSDCLDFGIVCTGGSDVLEDFVLAAQSCLRNPISRLYLDDESLSLAYQASLGLIYPSLYEGFGMPVIEAMASGCPVITTKNGSLAEAGGDAAYYIDGSSKESLLDAMGKLSTNQELSSKLREKGLQHAERFNWKKMASDVLDVLDLSCRHQCPTITEYFTKRLRAGQSALQI